ncbi:MAG TPA: hypothetical protein VNW06_03780 [Cytophagaceae bacterium]|jgi:hypothetical protein|nr:hypothetical protein [Cytophagaceae bacterium]
MFKIALSGKAKTGKDTAAKLIRKVLRKKASVRNVSMVAFAEPIKSMVMFMFPKLDKKLVFGPSELRSKIIPGAFDKDGQPLTVRRALLDIGTMLGRSYKDDVWLDCFDSRFDDLQYYEGVIVTDVRFRNEFDHLKKKGFYLIRVKRNTGTTINHSSEIDQEAIKDSEFDFVIDNNGTLKYLEVQVNSLVSGLMQIQKSDE